MRAMLAPWQRLMVPAAVALTLAIPAVAPNAYAMGVITRICLYSLLALSLSIVVGFARLLDLGYVGDGWSDAQIASALDTSVATVARTRQRLVQEGFRSVLVRKHSPMSARQRIFDGATEAKLIVLACPDPPKGRARWTLKLLEAAVVELHIVDRASDNTIGRTLKKTPSSPTCQSNGSSHPTPTPPPQRNSPDLCPVAATVR